MAQYGKVGAGPRIIVLVLLLLVLVSGGLLWFDWGLGIFNLRGLISPALQFFGLVPKTTAVDGADPLLLDRERLRAETDALTLRDEELTRRDEELAARESEINKKTEELEQKEKSLNDREKSLNERLQEYDNRNTNLDRVSGYLTSMPPQNAVSIINEMPDQDVIDIFRAVEQRAAAANEDSIVPFWLSLMDPARAATVKQKMLQ